MQGRVATTERRRAPNRSTMAAAAMNSTQHSREQQRWHSKDFTTFGTFSPTPPLCATPPSPPPTNIAQPFRQSGPSDYTNAVRPLRDTAQEARDGRIKPKYTPRKHKRVFVCPKCRMRVLCCRCATPRTGSAWKRQNICASRKGEVATAAASSKDPAPCEGVRSWRATGLDLVPPGQFASHLQSV